MSCAARSRAKRLAFSRSTITLPRKEWSKAHVVIGKYNKAGGKPHGHPLVKRHPPAALRLRLINRRTGTLICQDEHCPAPDDCAQ